MAARKKGRSAIDVLIVGGGIMGCASAWKLARAGLRAVVLERSVPGAEASSAAAGILGAQVESHAPGPLAELCAKSSRLYAAFAEALARDTAIDVELRQSGVLRVAFGARELAALRAQVRWQRPQVQILSRKGLLEREPALSGKLAGGAYYAGDGRVDPRRLLKALHIAAHRSGVEFRSGAYVRRIVCDGDVARGIALDDGTEISARSVLVAAGSWTTLVEGTGLAPGRVLPARGQIIELELSRPLLRSVVFGPGAYLVPRDDGRLLVGSTLEFVGYQREVTAGAVKNLLNAALTLVPALEGGRFKDAWSNFRPYTPDELPLIGRSPIKNLLLATGHFRNGILLAPITAEIIAALLLGKRPPIDLGTVQSCAKQLLISASGSRPRALWHARCSSIELARSQTQHIQGGELMASTLASRFDSPERAIRFIRADRTRRSLFAAVTGAIAIIVTLGAIYLVFSDIPAPHSPANATWRVLEPYR